jgi:hypothetical protein
MVRAPSQFIRNTIVAMPLVFAIVAVHPSANPDRDIHLEHKASVTETEPNDGFGQANLVTLGDTVLGSISSGTDVDYFAIDLDGPLLLIAGTFNQPGSTFGTKLRLYDTDGTTQLSSDTLFGAPAAVEVYIPAPGRYYLSVEEVVPSSVTNRLYGLITGTQTTGTGDPTSLWVGGFNIATRLIASPNGELIVGDALVGTKLVATDRTVSLLFPATPSIGVIAYDAHGDLLVWGVDTTRAIWRVWPDGSFREFLRLPEMGTLSGVPALGPDGHVWFGCTVICSALYRYDPTGDLVDTTATQQVPRRLAFSPAGDLYFSDGTAIYRLIGTSTQLVLAWPNIQAFAFDADGNIYFVTQNAMYLANADGQFLETPLARTGLATATDVAFSYTTSGAMSTQLLAAVWRYGSGSGAGAIVEIAPAGVRAVGYRSGPELLRIHQLPTGAVLGAMLQDTVQVAEAPGPVTWTVTEGELPPGITLEESSGALSGYPTSLGQYAGKLRAESGSRFDLARFEIEVVPPALFYQAAIDGLLGAEDALTADLERFLDLQGNGNGRYDVGDLRAFLRARKVLPPTARAGGRP